MEEDYGGEDYDFDDFEEYAESSFKQKRIGTPHSSKKTSPVKAVNWNEDEGDNGGEDDGQVDGQDLESYMKQFSASATGENANLEDLACELKPLDGVRPKLDDAEEEFLMHKLGYDRSNSTNASPVKGKSIRISTNSPSPTKGISFKSNGEDDFSAKYQSLSGIDEHPSTNTSKDNKTSPTPVMPKATHGAHKVGFSIDASSDAATTGEKKTGLKSPHVQVEYTEMDYISNFKSLLDSSPPSKSNSVKLPSPLAQPNAADLLLQKKQHSAESERENAERVDALLQELFPERFQPQAEKGKKGKGAKGKGKKAVDLATVAAIAGGSGGTTTGGGGGAGYSKNQTYGLAAPRAPLSSFDAHYAGSFGSHHSTADTDDSTQPSLMASLDQQLKLLKRELKAKDDKITRLTEHAVMMGNHMDKLKAEAAHLTVQLREANLELEAKEQRLQDALKQRKKLKKQAAAAAGGQVGAGADVGFLEHENQRLREREQALMDAIEELSNQNEELILKLKESMERELSLSSKRAAQVSQNVSSLADAHSHHYANHSQSHHHLPHIAGAQGAGGGVGGARAEAGLRTQSEPVAEVPKRRKKKASIG